MPFTKVGPNEYRSPSGRKFTSAQVRMYYATNGFKNKKKKTRKKHKDGYTRIVANKSRWQGDTDIDKKVIRVNKVKSKKKSTVIDTIVHEETHAKHPKMTERRVRIETKNQLKRMAENKKRKFYNLYKSS